MVDSRLPRSWGGEQRANVEERSVEPTGRFAGRLILVGVAVCVAGLAGAPLAAQNQTPTQRVLVLTPLPKTPSDSAYAVEFGMEFRSKLEGKTRREFSVVSTDKIGEALEASGFSKYALLDNNAAIQLARFLQADAYIVGQIDSQPTPRVDLHMIDLHGRSGLSGWVHAVGRAGMSGKDLAGVAADSMDRQLKAAQETRNCLDRRDRRDFDGAKERARRAFEAVPNHPAAAMCLAVVFEAQQAPPDSEIPALERAVKGDSLYTRAWDMLGRAYQSKATHQDSLKGADAFYSELQADPSDSKLRTGIAALLMTLKQDERAREVIDEGLKENPNDLAALQLKARACEDGAGNEARRVDSLKAAHADSGSIAAAQRQTASLWGCLASALAGQYDLDTTLVGKSDFYGKLFGAAQQAGDTAAMLKWSAEAVKRLPNDPNMWRARLAAFTTVGMTDSVLAADRRIAELDKTDIRPLLGMIQIYEDTTRLKIDSTVPLDTTSLKRVDSLLQRVVALKSTPSGQPTDTTVWINVALLYFQPATRMVQKRVNLPLAISWLEKSEKYDVRKQLTTQAEFFLGLAYTFNLSNAFDLQALPKTRSCKTLGELNAYLTRLKSAITTGASVQQATADQIMKNLEGLEKFVDQAGKAWKCRL
jgi:tetratricopeptide (TPR) repeat protein